MYYKRIFRFSYLGLYVFAGFTLDWTTADYNLICIKGFWQLAKLLKWEITGQAKWQKTVTPRLADRQKNLGPVMGITHNNHYSYLLGI